MKKNSNKNKSLFSKLLNNPMLKNKYLLYFVSIIVFIQIFTYLINYKFTAVVFFYILSLIIFQFNKNMVIVLAIPSVLTFFINNLLYKNNIEGLENKKDEGEDIEVEETNDEDEEPIQTDEDTELPDKNNEETLQVTNEQIQALINKSLSSNNSNKSKSGYKNIKKTPGLYTLPNVEQIKNQKQKAEKIEEAYDNLEKVIGKNGINSISSNTKELVKHQKELVSGLKEITPALDQAMSALGKVDMGKIMSIFNSFTPK